MGILVGILRLKDEKSRKVIVKIIMAKLTSRYEGDKIISDFFHFVKRNRNGVFLYLKNMSFRRPQT
ncbi:MAG: hypothetical protein ACYCPR_12335 [Thermoplasmataceae archaeon]